MTLASEHEVRVSHAVADTGGAWERAVREASDAHLAHAPEWFTAIRQAYGHEPLYLRAVDGDGGTGLLPAFVVRRPVFGTVVSSMPFLDGGGPCGSVTLARALVDRLISEARRIGAGLVELRCPEKLAVPRRLDDDKVNLTLPLPPDAGRLWRELDGSVRNQVRKAERAGLAVEVAGVEKLPVFYEIFAMRMRDLGSPVHGPHFFRAIFDAFGDRARLVLARKGDTPVGGLVALAFKDVLAVPWAACLKEHFRLCPNMLLYWETIRSASAEGFRRFDFGRSTRDSGTYHFKRQWGARETPLYWYRIPLGRRQGAPLSSTGGRGALLARTWRRLPVLLTRRIGPPVRRYLTQ